MNRHRFGHHPAWFARPSPVASVGQSVFSTRKGREGGSSQGHTPLRRLRRFLASATRGRVPKAAELGGI